MFRFEHGEYLYLLALVPVLVLLFWIARRARSRALNRFGQPQTMERIMPDMSRYKHGLKLVFIVVALLFLIVGMANPQWGSRKESVTRRAVDVFIALDVSQSMLAEDIVPSRLERAKRFTSELVQKLKGERMGLILFAGNSYLQVPLTTDYAAVELMLRAANPEMVPTQGTAISDALELANNSFPEDNQNHRAVILISDGENHEEGALDMARTVRGDGTMLFSIGVGTPEGSFIPVVFRGQLDYKRDERGEPVTTRLNEAMLEDIAEAGDGSYFNLLSGSDAVLEVLQTQIDRIEKRELEQQVFEEYDSYFQYFLLVALVFLVMEFLVSYRKNEFMRGRDFFRT